MAGAVVEGPLGMAYLTIYLVHIPGMGRVFEQRNGMNPVRLHRMENPVLSFLADMGREPVPYRSMAIDTLDAFLPAAVAISAGKAPLLVNIRDEVMLFQTIGSNKGRTGGIGSAILFAVVVFVRTHKIAAHVITVVTAQALPLTGLDKGMAF